MKSRYSIFSLARNAMNYHKDWERAWRSPQPKAEYDAVIVGAGGHGLATAYYLAKNHKMTNIAILEKGWLGGGNTGRNTTIIRSNYLQDPSIAIYELARSLYESLAQELNYNVMFSPRGVLMLCQTQHEFRAFQRTAHANRLAGLDCRMVTPAEVKEIVPIVNDDPNCRYPILGAYYQPRGGTGRHDAVAWGYARGADALGVDIIQNCEVTGFSIENGRVTGVDTTRGHIGAGRVVPADRVRINQALEDGSFYRNEAFLWAMSRARDAGRRLHLLGIVSFYSSHGSVDHLLALLEMARREGVPEVYVHAMLGRRGERPESGAIYIEQVEAEAERLGLGQVATVIGRFWSLDREGHWDRIEKTYRTLVEGEGQPVGRGAFD